MSSESVVLDLPSPISANKLWRSARGRVFKSKEYLAWLNEAGGCWMQQRTKLKTRSIKGHYALTILIHRRDNRRRDLGNCEKAASDLAQDMGIIEDDYLCARQVKEYCTESQAPLGMRLIFEPVQVTKDWVIAS